MQTDINIKIINWEKYQGRKDIKHHTWFRLQNELFTDPKFEQVEPIEMLCWVFILCTASKEQTSSLNLNLSWVERMSRIKRDVWEIALSNLSEIKVIEIKYNESVRKRNVSVQNPPATLHNITLHNKNNNAQQVLKKVGGATKAQKGADKKTLIFDFERIYEKYPRKKGKKRGMLFLQRKIKSQKAYDEMMKAVENYAKYCEDFEANYVKHFSTFVNEYEDWIKVDEKKNEVNIGDILTRRDNDKSRF